MTGSDGRLRRVLADMVADASDGDVTAEEVLAARHPLSALGVTSLTQIRLIDAIEDTFGIDVDLDDGLTFLDSLDAMVAYLDGRGVWPSGNGSPSAPGVPGIR
ncbi:MAG TPA: acyl carrier protein [Streptosporangiaceae bacterium]|jgi:acyl carrier protein